MIETIKTVMYLYPKVLDTKDIEDKFMSDVSTDLHLTLVGMHLRFSFLRFLIYGWFGWAIMLSIGVIISPLLFFYYMVVSFSIFLAPVYTKRKIRNMTMQGMGYYLSKKNKERIKERIKFMS